MTEHKDAMTPGQVSDIARWQKNMFDAGWVHLSNLLGYAKNTITDQAAELTALRAERDRDHAEINLKADFIAATVDQLAQMEADRDAALARVGVLEVALTFYADPETYETQYERMPCDCCTDIFEPINDDKGEKARAALANKGADE